MITQSSAASRKPRCRASLASTSPPFGSWPALIRSPFGEMTYGRYPAECDLAPLPFLSVGAAARSNCCAAVEPRTLTPVEPEAQTSAAVSEARVRVVVGGDHPLVQAGIVHVLEGAGFDVVGVAGDARDLIQITSVEQPDVVVTDIQMPPTSTDDGLKAAKEIRATW